MKRPGSRKRKRTKSAVPQPAPGDLSLVQAFLNTTDLRAGTDELADPQKLSDWLARHGLLGSGIRLTRTDLGKALDVRDGVRALLAAAGGAALDEDAVRRIDEVAQVARHRVRFHLDGTTSFEAQDFDEALGHLITLVVLTRREGLWDRFKICADSKCGAAFYDFSKSRSSKWCTERCGDRIRARSYRRGERYKERPHHSPPRLPRIFETLGGELDDD